MQQLSINLKEMNWNEPFDYLVDVGHFLHLKEYAEFVHLYLGVNVVDCARAVMKIHQTIWHFAVAHQGQIVSIGFASPKNKNFKVVFLKSTFCSLSSNNR